MREYIGKIKQSNYILNIATLMSGTLIAQVISLAFIPILTRLYTPAEFGLFSLFLTIISILGAVSSLKYDQAIMLPKNHKDAEALVFLSLIITLFITILSTIIIILFRDFFINYFDGKEYIIWLVPLGTFLIGAVQIFTAFTSRKQHYKTIATARVANSISLISIQSFSRYLFRLDGLILGKIVAEMVTLFILVTKQIKRQSLQLKSISKRRVKLNSKRYSNFPKYQSITVLFNAISQNLLILLLTSFYSVEVAGLYALSIRVLQAPVGLIGGSTREVYYQRASKMYSEGRNIFPIFYKTTISLLKIFIIPFFIVSLFGESLFAIIFGEEWIESGIIAQILIFWILFLFINSPSIATFNIIKLQKLQMIIEFFSVGFRFISIFIGYYFFNSYIMSIVLLP